MERKIERDISRETERDREKDAGIERLCLKRKIYFFIAIERREGGKLRRKSGWKIVYEEEIALIKTKKQIKERQPSIDRSGTNLRISEIYKLLKIKLNTCRDNGCSNDCCAVGIWMSDVTEVEAAFEPVVFWEDRRFDDDRACLIPALTISSSCEKERKETWAKKIKGKWKRARERWVRRRKEDERVLDGEEELK